MSYDGEVTRTNTMEPRINMSLWAEVRIDCRCSET